MSFNVGDVVRIWNTYLGLVKEVIPPDGSYYLHPRYLVSKYKGAEELVYFACDLRPAEDLVTIHNTKMLHSCNWFRENE